MAADFELTDDDLRVVVRYATQWATEVLPVFERAQPGDERPRAAIEAARQFVGGAPRSARQRTAAFEAHRAAKAAPSEAARLAAQSAGDAAAAAYLHPIAKAHQVGHILRAAANRALVAELESGGDPVVGSEMIEVVCRRTPPELVDVLCRYPESRGGASRGSRLMADLDRRLRASRLRPDLDV
ncbi:putative immunity protein [Gordonia sp. 'Campus']|uniref:putative immunity protein n=1 Tax=Gordonia sp. 'Campus' TaxID=2915824 RepID=UPI001EE4546A|nr:exonuclease SbcC [Gordonia sp. 'Campus']